MVARVSDALLDALAKAMVSAPRYPPCANPACDYTLCWMERRDWDQCPACGHPIPDALKVDQDFNPIPTSA